MTQRIDKWLVYARFVKHRARAQELIARGHVRINREKAEKASRAVKCGDILTLAIGGHVKVVRVLSEAGRRGSPASVASLYEAVDGTCEMHDPPHEKQGAQATSLC